MSKLPSGDASRLLNAARESMRALLASVVPVEKYRCWDYVRTTEYKRAVEKARAALVNVRLSLEQAVKCERELRSFYE